MIETGLYQHFNGEVYHVHGLCAQSSASNINAEGRRYVVYTPAGLDLADALKTNSVFIREVCEFLEYVKHDGKFVPRFKQL